ncbi:hypothetical protein S7711_06378 [Stachybotrys chartarum IBT 7711]|uniref:J domain-containing protein n=1 Tax=Stachybotrys chartarum (strain CBS 109288 / IBT 7711) TaxID=1280523 RepID=A0A084AGC0_STACB|nr:hypothetical protein S7711_06378 [Stachybotrys chartarum IBT 7711]
MGAGQSSDREEAPGGGSTPIKTCYYDLLSVDRSATDDEIKKAYRKKALELHPDRNFHDVESATKRFAEVQTAYEILSDPQERAWYDSHRDAILSGQDGVDGQGEPTTFRNVRLTSTEEILSLMRRFNASVPFDDEPTGFFGISRETFEHLALEEEAAADFDGVDIPEYPSFGSSDDDYDTVVKPFYAAWAGFSTRKSFSWKDKYRLSDAPDRRVRRIMEKENKKCRDDAAREFNDAVRFLVSFVRKRDPRYLPNTQTDADRQKALRDAAAAQAARSRAANKEKMASSGLADWARSRGEDIADTAQPSDFDESEDSEVEILECVVCNKTFKSDKQLEAHERSKKHVKALQQLRREMKREGVDLELDATVTPDSEPDEARSAFTLSDSLPAGEVKQKASDAHAEEVASVQSGPIESPQTDDFSENDDYAPRSAVQERIISDSHENPATSTSPNDTDETISAVMEEASISGSKSKPKVGMAKLKRERKAAVQAQQADSHQCTICNATFESRTKLFSHIREENHAMAIPGLHSSKKKSKNRKR